MRKFSFDEIALTYGIGLLAKVVSNREEAVLVHACGDLDGVRTNPYSSAVGFLSCQAWTADLESTALENMSKDSKSFLAKTC